MTRAFLSSASTGEGVMDLWAVIEKFVAVTQEAGTFKGRRAQQEQAWVLALVHEGLENLFRSHPGVAAQMPLLEQQVARGEVPATVAAQKLLDLFRRG